MSIKYDDTSIWMVLTLHTDGKVKFDIPPDKEDFNIDAKALARVLDKLRKYCDDWETDLMEGVEEEETVH